METKKYIFTPAELRKNLCSQFETGQSENLVVYEGRDHGFSICDSIYCQFKGGLSSVRGNITENSGGGVVVEVGCGVGCKADGFVTVPSVKVEIDKDGKKVWGSIEVKRVKLAGRGW